MFESSNFIRICFLGTFLLVFASGLSGDSRLSGSWIAEVHRDGKIEYEIKTTIAWGIIYDYYITPGNLLIMGYGGENMDGVFYREKVYRKFR